MIVCLSNYTKMSQYLYASPLQSVSSIMGCDLVEDVLIVFDNHIHCINSK